MATPDTLPPDTQDRLGVALLMLDGGFDWNVQRLLRWASLLDSTGRQDESIDDGTERLTAGSLDKNYITWDADQATGALTDEQVSDALSLKVSNLLRRYMRKTFDSVAAEWSSAGLTEERIQLIEKATGDAARLRLSDAVTTLGLKDCASPLEKTLSTDLRHLAEEYQQSHFAQIAFLGAAPCAPARSENIHELEASSVPARDHGLVTEVAEIPIPTPASNWDAVEISFLSDLRVQVFNGANTESYNYAELGFRDRRSGKPNRAWLTLRAMAERNGTIQDGAETGTAWPEVEKRMQEIRKALRNHFRSSADPVPYVKGTGYRMRFKIGCGPSYHT